MFQNSSRKLWRANGIPGYILRHCSYTGFLPSCSPTPILKRVKNYEFWVTQSLKWGTPASIPLAAVTPVRHFKNYLDPTSIHLPVVGNNKEAILFRHVERFRFADQNAFDFRGERERNSQDKEGTLANSNQRALKGFTPTFTLARDFGGLVGRYKLDWFFVKPFIPQPRGAGMSYEFAPHFPLTMRDLNNAVPDGVSDHAPITVDLPIGDPSATRLSKAFHETVPSRPDVPGTSRRTISSDRSIRRPIPRNADCGHSPQTIEEELDSFLRASLMGFGIPAASVNETTEGQGQ